MRKQKTEDDYAFQIDMVCLSRNSAFENPGFYQGSNSESSLKICNYFGNYIEVRQFISCAKKFPANVFEKLETDYTVINRFFVGNFA